MAYNETLNNRIREALENVPGVEERYMFGGVCYMINGKMCAGIVKEEMMCRIGEAAQEEALKRKGCREMDFAGKPMKGYVYVSDEGMRNQTDLNYWIGLCLAHNPQA
ncbi:MAG: TfoX/Sxy family protein [Bacteroidetes bacterium]|jgi:TfoX/Sxy family transcriptional regulator of competence genes|nr:TfoX/Sxy family protein [Bacteroidota bacterium]